jgi:hypothetical protein
MKSLSSFIAITSEGGLLPADFLRELPDPKTSIEGLTPVAYHLAEGERLNEQINRSWHRLKGCWENFKKAIAGKQSGEPTTTDTRERWLLPLFQELGFGRVTIAKPIEVDGRSYAVSHGWNQVPIHLVGSHADLDCRTPGAIGAAKASPHSLVQSALNASDAHLWGIVSNGFNLRLLRDNIALTRMAYVEFDLQAMFDGDLYSEFFVLWLVCHQSRFEGEKPSQYWLERWKKAAEDKTLRALDDLYPGVQKAIAALGAGLVSHGANGVLLEKLRTGRLTTQEFYKQVLRVIYRMLFLLVAEDRALLHVQDDSEAALKARRRYRDFYSLARLRGLSRHRAGTPHPDLWHVFQFVTAKLGSDTGCPELALPPLGSFLWTAAQSTPDLLDSLISNRHFLEAVHALAFVQDENVRRAVDYKNLGSEELGSVYQGLLEMHPRINADAGSFELDIAAGNERKTSGSYYTPDSLVQCLLDSALEPVIAERLAKAKTQKEKETALLSLKVCDMAVGSGHFPLRAAHRIARHLARVRSGEEEPSPAVYRTALRDVIGHCLYGVDINPMAIELCKVTLWLETLEPGKPLSFLDHHIRCGNSLLGTTPELISAGLPDDAFDAIEGDDKAACSSLKKLNRTQREGLRHLFIAEDTAIRERMHQAAAAIDEINDSRPEDIHRKEAAFRNAQQNYDFQKAWDLANLWCAAFVIKKYFPGGASVPASFEPSTPNPQPLTVQAGLFGSTEETSKAKSKKTQAPSRTSSKIPIGITTQHLRDFVAGGELPDGLLAESKRLADQFQFFHFHLAFPEVSAQGGFDVSLGNPPWERVKLEEKQWVAERRPAIANAPNADARKKLIESLRHEDPTLFSEFEESVRRAEGESHIMRNGGIYPLCGRGDINLYAVFTEAMRRHLSKAGRVGCIVQSDIATNDTCKFFFDDLITKSNLVSFFDFVNTEGIFPAIHRTHPHFCLLTMESRGQAKAAQFSFWNTNTTHLQEMQRRFTLSVEDIIAINPNSRTCPVFRSVLDAELTKFIYQRVPVLVRLGPPEVNPWELKLSTMFHMSNDSRLFRTREQLEDEGYVLNGNIFQREQSRLLPLYEGRLGHQFNHRFAKEPRGQLQEITEDEHKNPNCVVEPQYWVSDEETLKFLESRKSKSQTGLLGFRRISNSTNERTAIAAVIPWGAASYGWILTFGPDSKDLSILSGAYNSFVLDYLIRNSLSQASIPQGTFEELPIPAPAVYAQICRWSASSRTLRNWLLPRVLELTYTAWDLEAFAQDCGWCGPPFRWDKERRFLLRSELDAAFFHLYLGPETEWRQQPAALTQAFPTPRHAADYIMDTFPIVKRKDEAKFHGDYRTKRVVLETYDALAESMHTGKAYQTRLDSIPASFRSAHTPRIPQDKRIALDSAEKFLLSFIYGFLHQTHEEATFDLLDSVFHLLRQRDRHADEFATAIGGAAKSWLSSFNDKLPNKEFLPFLKRLEADGWITAERRSGHLSITEKFPSVPLDAWRNYDISAALRVIAQQPGIASLVLAQPDTPLASREFQFQKTG